MISFIYFDLGGVAVDDFTGNNKWQELGDEMGLSAENRDGFKQFWQDHERKFCTTEDIDTFLPDIEKELDITLPDGFSLLHALVDRFYENKPIQLIIKEISTKVPIGLLTNASPGMLDLIFQKGIMPDVDWNQIVDSSVVHVMKPDVKMFEIAQQKASTPANEILFIDNKKSHCKAAKALGWQTFYYDSANREKSATDLSDFLSTQRFN